MNSIRQEIVWRALFLLPAVVLMAGCSCTSRIGRGTAQYPLPVLSREQWQAADPVAEMQPQRVERITIHHTATLQNPERSLTDKLRALQQFSQNEGRLGSGRVKPPWPDVPYHFYIDVHGAVGEGRDIRFAGDTNTEYDPGGHALIVLEGNFEEEQPSQAQLDSLRTLTRWLAGKYRITPDRIGGHKDFARTACPGANLRSRLPELRDFVIAND